LCPRWYDMSLVNTCYIRGVWSIHIEVYLVSSLIWEGFY